MAKLFQKRGTRAQIEAAKAASQLNAGEVYVITDENRLAVGLSESTYQDYVKAPIVTTWAGKPAISTLKNYIDRVFITDVGVGGSEWYSDGTRYRAVGGRVILLHDLTTGTAITATNAIIKEFKLPSGIVKANDKIEVEYNVLRTAGTAGINASCRISTAVNGGAIGVSSVNLDGASGYSNSVSFNQVDFSPITSTTLRGRFVGSAFGFSVSNNAYSITTPTSLLSNDIYIGVTTSAIGTGNTLNNDYLMITLKTCG